MKILAIVCLALFLSCGNSKVKEEYNQEYSIDDQSVEVDTSQVISGTLTLINEDAFFVPDDWESDKTNLYFKIKSLEDSTTTMNVVKVIKEPKELSLRKYVELDFQAFNETKGAELKNYELVHFIYDGSKVNEVYSGVYDVDYKSLGSFTSLVHFFEFDKYIYVFVLQTPTENKEKYMTFFSTLVYSYQNNGQEVFSPYNKVSSVERIRF